MVTTAEDGGRGSPDDYVHVDWGASFQASLQAAFPEIVSPGVLVSHGPLALLYLTRVGGTGYFRRSVVQPHIDARRLRRVADAPEFSYSLHMIYSSRAESGLIDRMRRGFRSSAAAAGETLRP